MFPTLKNRFPTRSRPLWTLKDRDAYTPTSLSWSDMSVLHFILLGESFPRQVTCLYVLRQQFNVTWFKRCFSSSSSIWNVSYKQYKKKDALRCQCSDASSKYSVAYEDFLHTSCEKGGSPLCARKLTFNAFRCLKDLLHTSHENGYSSSWMSTCLFCVKDFLHTSHEKGCSQLWVNTLIFNADLNLKDFNKPQIQWKVRYHECVDAS